MTLARACAWMAAASCLVVAFGCHSAGPSSDASATGATGTVTFMIEAAPTNLDPRMGTDAQSQQLDGLLFDSLVTHDAQMNIVPDLAESWETPDPRTYIFHLRKGVRFHDGRAATSADVKFTFDSILSGQSKSTKRGAFKLVDSVEAPDDATVIFHLSQPYASFLWNITPESVGIVPRDSGPQVAEHPVGTGPFRFVSMTQDEEIVLERNPDYFGGAPKIERVRFRIVPDAIVRALELRKGTADLSSPNSLTADMVATLAKQPGIAADEAPGTQIAYVAFNLQDPILKRREVRQALSYATDRETMVRYLLRGQARLASSLLPPNHWAYNADVRQYGYDPSRANQMLDAAGFPRGPDGVRFHLALKTSTEESTRLLSEALAGQWKSVGVALDSRPLEAATFYADVTRGSFQLYTLRWVGANNDPDIFDYVFNSARTPPSGANRGHYSNPALDKLLDQERTEMDQEKRKALMFEIQKIVAEDEPYINLWYTDNVCVHRDRVGHIEMAPAGGLAFLDTMQLR